MTAASAPSQREPAGPAQLSELVERGLRGIPVFRAALESDASFALMVPPPRRHDRDSHGRSWNIEAFRSSFVHWHQGQAEFRAIVDRLRDRYDLR